MAHDDLGRRLQPAWLVGRAWRHKAAKRLVAATMPRSGGQR
jgi:hypothetical protein